MTPSFSRFAPAVLAVALFCSPVVPGASAQTPKVEPRRPAPASGQVTQMDAQGTREALMRILENHPPSVGRVLKLDPSLMRSETYLASYPELRDFLAQHEEIPQNAQFYLEGIRIGQNDNYQPRSQKLELLAGILAGFAAFIAAGIIFGTLIWLIRTVLDQRRWSRLSKIQAEVHSKLMDRFSSNDELLTYVQTPSGRRFLESGPSPLQEAGPAMAAPIARILWSMQIGAVLLVTGMGLLFLSSRALFEAQEFFYIAGCMSTAVGAGFLVSAVAAYVLSRRLGLIDRQTPGSGPAEINA
jgi:hypothetical protein